MYVLDSNAFSELNRHGQQKLIGRRVAAIDPALIALTVITIEEALEGRLKQIRNPENVNDMPEYYGYLLATFNELKKYRIFPYTLDAEKIYWSIPKNVRDGRVHDCRIASIAVAFNQTVVTMNIKEDFSRIKEALSALKFELKFEDWTIA